MEENTPVLIIGGSLVGLSAALFLAAQQVACVVVERHRGSSPHPRAIGYTPRTMELFSAVGLAGAIPQAPANFRLRRARISSLAGEWFGDTEWTPESTVQRQVQNEVVEYSPCTGAAIAQDHLEPLLRERAKELGADLRLGTELISWSQDETGVTAHVRERDGERAYTLRASYLIAADGNTSPIREQLGITRQGMGHLSTVRSVLFRAPLEQYLETGVHQFEIEQPDFKAFLTTYNDGRWVLMFTDDVDRNESELRAAITQAIGRTDVPIELITQGRWELAALIANEFSKGRVFLAGDAAHTLPPTRGGFGANTGIQDAHNLAWKLAAVLNGSAQPALLDTYSAERQPVAWERHQQTFARPDFAAYATEETRKIPLRDDVAMEFGQLYRSAAILGADDTLPPALRPDQWQGQPGTRAPHQWLTVAGERRSVLDLFQRGWVLLTENAQWLAAAAAANYDRAVYLTVLQVGVTAHPADPTAFRQAYGLGRTGAVLIRPDGFIAWRSADVTANCDATLASALRRVSFTY